jgi:hypothetical protein
MARAASRSRCCFHRSAAASSWCPPVGRGSWGVDAAGGPPYGYVGDECGARVASRRSPDWLIVGSGCEVSNLAGEVGDVLCSFGQVVTPGGMGLNRVWNVWEPRQRSCFGCRECCEAPVDDGGHVSCGREFASAGGFL